MRIILLILVLIIPSVGFTQDPQLLDNDWYVERVNYSNTDYFPPIEFVGRIYFYNNNTMEVYHPECEEGFGSDIEYNGNDTFNIDDGGVVDIGLCIDPEILIFTEKHYQIYHDEIGYAKNPFNYTIVSENDLLVLTIINIDGDQAIYVNELLSISDLNESSISIFPNPVKDVLRIDNTSSTEITSINIYDVLGRLVLAQKRSVSEIDISHLNCGVLFLEFETEEGVITKKIIKE
jgi:hypothetical protein